MPGQTLISMNTFSTKIFYVSLALAGLVLGLHCLILWIAPFESIYPTEPAIAILWAFFAVFFVFARLVLTQSGMTPIDRLAPRITLDEAFQDRRLQTALVLVSLVGVILHVWTKHYLTLMHPITCISEIRFAWTAVDRSVLPFHIRIGSILGHLLTSFAYLGVMAASFNIVRSGWIKRSDQILQLFFVIVGVLYAGFIGSRNVMLAFLAMGLVGTLLGITYPGRTKQLRRQFRVFVAGLLLPVVSTVLFSSLIFSDRLFCDTPNALIKLGWPILSTASNGHIERLPLLHPSAGQTSAGETSAGETSEFHMAGNYKEFALVPRYYDGQSDWRRTLFIYKCSICGPTMVYVNHGIFNLSGMMASEARGGAILLTFLGSWLERLGFIEATAFGRLEKRVYGPGGISLAGAAYHDYGVAGLAITAAVLGGLFGGSIRMMRANGTSSLVGVWLFSCLLYVLLISNMFVGFNVLPFPFIAFGVGCGLAAWLVINNWRLATYQGASFQAHTAEDGTHV